MLIKNRAGIRRIGKAVSRFTVDYCHRHRHPVNAALHIVGVPAAFYGFYLLLTGLRPSENSRNNNFGLGLVFVFVGYLFQYLGHRSQGNEVGEVILLKKIARKLGSRFDQALSDNGDGIWKILGGTRSGAVIRTSAGSSSHSASASAGNGNSNSNGNGNGNGNGHKHGNDKFTSHSLVWWKRP
jgi:hypothetical protein